MSSSAANRTRLLLFLGIAPVIIALDQWTKGVIDASFAPYETRIIIDGFFNLQYVRNPGFAFGLFSDVDHPLRYPFQIALVGITIAIVVYLFVSSTNPHRAFAGALSLITGGAVGNLIDRVRFEYVIDFVQWHVGPYYWPNFNVADAAITVGTAMLALELLYREPKLERALSAREPADTSGESASADAPPAEPFTGAEHLKDGAREA